MVVTDCVATVTYAITIEAISTVPTIYFWQLYSIRFFSTLLYSLLSTLVSRGRRSRGQRSARSRERAADILTTSCSSSGSGPRRAAPMTSPPAPRAAGADVARKGAAGVEAAASSAGDPSATPAGRGGPAREAAPPKRPAASLSVGHLLLFFERR